MMEKALTVITDNKTTGQRGKKGKVGNGMGNRA
jgi:hypothetical protein